jgi:hypothetical protein
MIVHSRLNELQLRLCDFNGKLGLRNLYGSNLFDRRRIKALSRLKLFERLGFGFHAFPQTLSIL